VKKPKLHHRLVFGATLKGDILEVRRGAHRRTVDSAGDVVSTSWDGSVCNWGTLNIGSMMIAIGEETNVGVVEVVEVVADWKRVRIKVVSGDLKDGSLHLQKFTPKKAKRAAA
jgi:hypothetical protein